MFKGKIIIFLLNYLMLKKIREIWMKMVSTTNNSTEDMIKKLQSLKRKTKLKFYKVISNFYAEMNIRNFRYEEDPFSKNAETIKKIYNKFYC